VLIFSYFAVPAAYQHRVPFWGILGALIMRGIMIGLGAALIERFGWISYLFGAFLVFTGIRMAFQTEEAPDPAAHPPVKRFKRIIPVSTKDEGGNFFVRHVGKLVATPPFVVLLLIENIDLIFAVDSIPALFAVTTDPFIVFTSTVFAILGLRSLYLILRGAVDRFHYLKIGLAAVLAFVGIKILAGHWYHLPRSSRCSLSP